VPEKAEQAHGVQVLRLVCGRDAVYVVGTHRRRGDYPGTMQTPGISDVFAFLPPRAPSPRRTLLWWEAKRVGGRMTPEQVRFKDLVESAGLPHVVGPLDALLAFLVTEGYVQAESFPHYRQPKDRA
jgi:hypothetical protein